MPTERDNMLKLTLPEPAVILGQRLRPLSVGHLHYLDRLDLIPADTTDRLVLAVLICTSTCAEIETLLADRWLSLKIKWWLFLHSPVRRIKWDEKFFAWDDYFQAGTKTPSVINRDDHDSGIKDSATPFLQHLKVTLQHALNYSPSEAMNAPYAQAMLEFYAYHEMQGSIEIVDPVARRKLKEHADKHHDEWIAEAIKMRAEAGILGDN